MYLLDTNIFLELMLKREEEKAVRLFLQSIGRAQIFISDFAFHSLGVILFKLNRQKNFIEFTKDEIINGNLQIIKLEPEDMTLLNNVATQFNLDFDDAYQYAIAEKYTLEIISLDSDFDATEKGRRSP